jgi:CheY-like chemotaxis protein
MIKGFAGLKRKNHSSDKNQSSTIKIRKINAVPAYPKIMLNKGPIVIVEDDEDDRIFLEEVIRDLGVPNPIIWLPNGVAAFEYLKTHTEQPFLIISDINMPLLNGIELKRQIDHDIELRQKSIPFVFLTTSVSQETIDEAYNSLTVQGFFRKSNTLEGLREVFRAMIAYWKVCHHPNSSD